MSSLLKNNTTLLFNKSIKLPSRRGKAGTQFKSCNFEANNYIMDHIVFQELRH